MRGLLGSLSRPVGRGLDTFLDRIRSFLALVADLVASTRSPNLELVENPLSTVGEPGPESSGGCACTVAEVVGVTSGHGPEFVGGAALVGRDTVRVEVGFQLRVGPGVKGSIFGSIGGRGKVGSDGSVATASRFGSAGVAVLSLLKKILTSGAGLVRGLVVLRGKPFPA